MKKLLFSGIMAIIAIAMIIGVNSCKNETVNPESDLQLMTVNEIIPDAAMSAFDAKEFTVYGDLTNDISVYPPLDGNITQINNGSKKSANISDLNDRMGNGFHLRRILGDLKLSRSQMRQISDMVDGYEDCVRNVMLIGRDARKAAHEAAKAARADLLLRVKAGLDRATAKAELDLIMQKLKADLNASIDQNALCLCLADLYTKIIATLADPAKTKFEDWLATHPLPCMDKTTDPGFPAP